MDLCEYPTRTTVLQRWILLGLCPHIVLRVASTLDTWVPFMRKTICYCYCHPMYAKLGLNVAKDHERMRAHKAADLW